MKNNLLEINSLFYYYKMKKMKTIKSKTKNPEKSRDLGSITKVSYLFDEYDVQLTQVLTPEELLEIGTELVNFAIERISKNKATA